MSHRLGPYQNQTGRREDPRTGTGTGTLCGLLLVKQKTRGLLYSAYVHRIQVSVRSKKKKHGGLKIG